MRSLAKPSRAPLRAMPRTLLAVALLAAPLALAACGETPSLPTVNAARPVTVERIDRRAALYFPTGSAEPDAASQARLLAALRDLPEGVRARARLTAHADARGQDAANLALSRRRAERVAQIVHAAAPGTVDVMILPRGELDPLGDAGRDRRVDLQLSWAVATPPPCGQWSSPFTGDHFNEPSADLGCANRANLARMVADPLDLVSGRPLDPADGSREADAILRYRTDKVKVPSAEATH